MARLVPPQPGPTQRPCSTDSDQPTTAANLYIFLVPADDPYSAVQGGEQLPSAVSPISRVIITLVWAATVIGTLTTTTPRKRP